MDRTCKVCGKNKSETPFREHRRVCMKCQSKKVGDKTKQNRTARNAYRRKQYAQNPIKEKSAHLKYQYGITIEQYNKMFIAQNGICAICEMPERSISSKSGNVKKLSVDHNHDTGEIRGLLCEKCNRGIGYLDESILIIKRAIDYLTKESN